MQLSELEIVDVAPCRVPASCPPGMWPCRSCGEDHPVQDNWVVSFKAQPFRDIRQTLVCEHCADDLGRRARISRRTAAATARRERVGRAKAQLRR